jgi:MFS superfamily sulfate permease-like transporter
LHGKWDFVSEVTVERGDTGHQRVRRIKGAQREWLILDLVEGVAVGIVVLIEPSAVESASLAGSHEAVAELNYYSASVDVVHQAVA